MKSIVPVLLASAALCTPGIAAAQASSSSTQAADQNGGDIIVTAQRRETTLQDTPVAISAFTASMLQDRGVVKMENIAAQTPGLNIQPVTASPNAVQISMRGAFEQNGGTSTSESPVAIYIDDVYQSRLSAANYDLADIERVEVLRGPQGTLYGRNSMTGAIKLVTRQPDGSTWFNTDLSYASYQETKIKGSVGMALTDHIALAASGFYDHRDKGWMYDATLDKRVGTFTRYGGQIALGIYDVPNLEASVTGRTSASLSDGQYYVPVDVTNGGGASSGFYTSNTPREADGDTRQKSLSGHLGYDFGSVKVRSITAYQHLTDNWAMDFSGGYDDPYSGQTIAGFYRSSTARQHQFSEELQALGSALDDRLNWIVGGFYFKEKSEQTFNDELAAYGLSYQPSRFDQDSESLAGYAQVDYKLLDKLTATVGLRFSHDDKNFLGLSPNGAGTDADLVASTASVKANVWTPRFNLQYDFTPDIMAYATVSKGYRAGGFNSLVVADPTNYGSAYKPETVWSYEGGLKLQGFDRKAHLNIAAYYEDLKDLQTLADIGGGSFITQNAAGARIWGIEWEAGVTPAKGLSLFASGAYTNDKYTELAETSQAYLLGAERLPLISRWQWQAGGSYELGLGESAGSLVFAGDVNHRDEYYGQVANYAASLVPGYTRANASVTWKNPSDKLEVYLQATNVTNAKDYASALVFIAGVFGNTYPQEPRIVRGGFRYKF
ncbi:TonB-dependent receptor [Novosphingobium profundi]|uniref:TonB-dependent receptor n=1 Tax=Novosphingobium profundi TaxID=1774954 RepID=UPI001BDAE208|nr:TonB-dependent receptor [Novosphingobium profundi]MBT0669769.1 TonB-dependent receptor [Novosphingobium profundi]